MKAIVDFDIDATFLSVKSKMGRSFVLNGYVMGYHRPMTGKPLINHSRYVLAWVIISVGNC